MTDLRQGVTETQHAVLDLIEEDADWWNRQVSLDERLRKVEWCLNDARGARYVLSHRRLKAIEGAARLINAAEEMGRILAQDGAA